MADTSTDDKKITIDSYTGSNDGEDLVDCYFKLKHDDTYTFHDKDDHAKCSGMTVGSQCSFQLDEDPNITWTITLVAPCNAEVVNGSWNNDDPGIGAGEGGTFQAQAGGGAGEDEEDDEDESASSAYA
jgi:hypothetical protein